MTIHSEVRIDDDGESLSFRREDQTSVSVSIGGACVEVSVSELERAVAIVTSGRFAPSGSLAATRETR